MTFLDYLGHKWHILALYVEILLHTYGYLAANDGHLTSFASDGPARSFGKICLPGRKNIKTRNLESTLNNENKYEFTTQEWRTHERKYADENRTRMTKKWDQNCEAYVAVDEKLQNQNGVVFFSNLKDATKIVLVKWGVNNIG